MLWSEATDTVFNLVRSCHVQTNKCFQLSSRLLLPDFDCFANMSVCLTVRKYATNLWYWKVWIIQPARVCHQSCKRYKFSMVTKNHSSNIGMVAIHRYGLKPLPLLLIWQDVVFVHTNKFFSCHRDHFYMSSTVLQTFQSARQSESLQLT